MFEDIQAIFSETTVGLSALTILFYLFWWWFGRDQNKSYLKYCLDTCRSISQVVAVSLFFFVYGLGLVIHDTADLVAEKYNTVSETSIGGFFAKIPILHVLLSSEGDRRVAVLFDKECNAHSLWTSILSEKDYVKTLLERIHEDPLAIEEFLENNTRNCNTEGNAEKYVNTIYYDAKNWAYMQDTYYAELAMIQHRIDFARCISLVAFCSASIMVFSFFLCLALRFQPPIFSRALSGAQKRKSVRSLPHKLIAIIVLVVFSYFSSEGFQAAEKHFNQRTLGYYYSYLRAKKIRSQLDAKTKETPAQPTSDGRTRS